MIVFNGIVLNLCSCELSINRSIKYIPIYVVANYPVHKIYSVLHNRQQRNTKIPTTKMIKQIFFHCFVP